jgi:glycosyltransferase involved in cell wall biosynthesis
VVQINPEVRPIAFYLPQYHPIPENDKWWGKGFTEWTNVVKAKPLFTGHYQPHLPADLGFYDLRLPEARQAQADLAEEYGIYGFCYYHYWFNGHRLLERPFEEVLSSAKPNFPFCLCWANENWTRAWDGLDHDILLRQKYNSADDRQHLRSLARAFLDKRYIRVNDKPLFLVYRISRLPNPLQTVSIWREEAHKMGIGDLYLCTVESLRDDRVDPTRIGFDAAVEFQPDWLTLPSPLLNHEQNNQVYDYSAFVKAMIQRTPPTYKRFPCVTPSWDNTARRQRDAAIFHNSTPECYQQWLETVIEGRKRPTPEENLIFINAWNEWGEGAHLEPCQKWGRAYLEATQNALKKTKALSLETSLATSKASEGLHQAPEVSVCIPIYNGSKYLTEAIRSVLEQNWSDFELIIVDDCSIDNSEAIVRSFTDRRIKFFKNPVRLGLVGNWNRCIELSRGKYICIFHQDDVMMPENLAKKIKVLEENSNVGMVHSNVYQIGAKGEILSEAWYFKPDPNEEVVQKGSTIFEKLIQGVNIVCCPSAVVKRECYENLGSFDPQLPFTVDWEMWLRLALFYDIAYLPETLVKYRRHDANETLNFLEVKELEHSHRAKMRVLEKYPDRIPYTEALKREVNQHYKQQALDSAVQHYTQQQYPEARPYLAFALELHQTTLDNGSGGHEIDWLFEVAHKLNNKGGDMEAKAPLPAIPLAQQLSVLLAKDGPIYRQIIQDISGEEMARLIPIRRIIQAIAFKIGNQPYLGWLYKFRGLGRRTLGESRQGFER